MRAHGEHHALLGVFVVKGLHHAVKGTLFPISAGKFEVHGSSFPFTALVLMWAVLRLISENEFIRARIKRPLCRCEKRELVGRKSICSAFLVERACVFLTAPEPWLYRSDQCQGLPPLSGFGCRPSDQGLEEGCAFPPWHHTARPDRTFLNALTLPPPIVSGLAPVVLDPLPALEFFVF